jgi:hypothetical protein
MKEFILVVIAILAFFGLIGYILNWGGKCKTCKSLNTHKTYTNHEDDHRPGGRWETTTVVCKSCGLREIIKNDFVENR